MASTVPGRNMKAGLAVGQNECVVMDLGPAEVHDFTLAAPGEQQKANDVRLLPAAFPGLPVENPVQTADLLSRQEAREPGSAVGPDALRGVLLDVAASDREVHDLPEKVERMVGIAGSGAAEGIEPAPEPSRVDTVEPLRPGVVKRRRGDE